MKLRPFIVPTPFSVSVNCDVTSEEFSFEYLVSGPIDLLRFSLNESPTRKMNLWENTVFELFVRNEQKPEYWEYNFAANGSWNCFHFLNYRHGMSEEALNHSPKIKCDLGPQKLKIVAFLDRKEHVFKTPFSLGLSSILFDQKECKHYFAGHHPSSKPDFHDPKNYTLQFKGDAFCSN